MNHGRVLTVALVAVFAMGLVGNAAALTYDANLASDVIFGSGNGDGFFTVGQSWGVEVALRAKIRFLGTYNSGGDGTYSFAAGDNWNFEWSINSDYNETTGVKLDDLTYLLEYDTDPSTAITFAAFDPINGINPGNSSVLWDHGIGTNTTANGAGDDDAGRTAATYATLIAQNNVAQNSWRNIWFSAGTSPGTYNYRLTAYTGNSVLASTAIQVIVDGGGPVVVGGVNGGALAPAPVPEPASMALLGLGLVGIAARYRKRKEA